MQLRDIPENYHVKRAIEVALVDYLPVNLISNENTIYIAEKFKIWISGGRLVVRFNKAGVNISVAMVNPTRPYSPKLQESDTTILDRVKVARNVKVNTNLDDTCKRLLRMALKSHEDLDVEFATMVATSIAKLANSEIIQPAHLAEALQYLIV